MPQRIELTDKEAQLVLHHSELFQVRLQTLMEVHGIPLNSQLTPDGKAFLVPDPIPVPAPASTSASVGPASTPEK